MNFGEFIGVMLIGIGLLAGQIILEIKCSEHDKRITAIEKQLLATDTRRLEVERR